MNQKAFYYQQATNPVTWHRPEQAPPAPKVPVLAAQPVGSNHAAPPARPAPKRAPVARAPQVPPPAVGPAAQAPLPPPVMPLAVEPLVNQALPTDRREQWVRDNLPCMDRKNQANLYRLIAWASLDPLVDFAGTPRFERDLTVNKADDLRSFYRLQLADGRWQRATATDLHCQAMMIRGGHGTSATGILGILRDRQVKAFDFPGVYGQFTIHGTDRAEVRRAIERVAGHTKNCAGVIPEMEGHSQWTSLQYGTVEDDKAALMKGFTVHNVSNKRWCMPVQFISLKALWVPCTGWLCDDLPGFVNPADDA